MGLGYPGQNDNWQTPEVWDCVDFSVQNISKVRIVCILPHIWVCLL